MNPSIPLAVASFMVSHQGPAEIGNFWLVAAAGLCVVTGFIAPLVLTIWCDRPLRATDRV